MTGKNCKSGSNCFYLNKNRTAHHPCRRKHRFVISLPDTPPMDMMSIHKPSSTDALSMKLPAQAQISGTIHSYDDTLSFLDTLDVSAIKLGLERIQKLLATLGQPQDALPMVHIAGTNGKGSVTAMLASVLKFAGYSVGTFTSPHLIHVRERIAINGNPILPDDFQHEVNALKTHLEQLDWPCDEWPTYFEFLNVVAYQYFHRKGVDITVFETGLGGRLDSTNVVKHPNLTVITTIGMDHMQHLGDTLGKIAAEKAGIIKRGVPLVIGASLPNEARDVILKKADEQDAPVFEATVDKLAIDPNSSPHSGLIINNMENNRTYRLSLLAPYQKQNLATVLACVHQLRQQNYEIDEEAICEGLMHTYWPVRFQYFPKENLLLDGSHNPDGFSSLAESLTRYYPHTPKIWLISLRANRNPSQLLDVIQHSGEPLGIITTQASPEHLYYSPNDLAEQIRARFNLKCPIFTQENPTEALTLLKKLQAEAVQPQPLGIVTGSLYTAGEVLHCLNQG
jgi:dihydrofolate synthase / folylpolyglutamate synthase